MMIIIKTHFSTYEIDLEASRVRRVFGENEPTPCFGADGDWHTFTHMTPPEPLVGQSVEFYWPVGRPNDYTRTSRVEDITINE